MADGAGGPAPVAEEKIHAIYWKTKEDNGKTVITKMAIQGSVTNVIPLALPSNDADWKVYDSNKKTIISEFKAAVKPATPSTGGAKKNTKRRGSNKRNTRRRRRF
jgi:hypothetical protein